MALVNTIIDLSWIDRMVTTKGWVTIDGHHVNIGEGGGGSGGGGGGRTATSLRVDPKAPDSDESLHTLGLNTAIPAGTFQDIPKGVFRPAEPVMGRAAAWFTNKYDKNPQKKEVAWKQEEVNIADLMTSQKHVRVVALKPKLRNDYSPIAPNSPKAKTPPIGNNKSWEGKSIWVVRTPKGDMVLVDGHHRALAEAVKGHKTIKALVVDIPPADAEQLHIPV